LPGRCFELNELEVLTAKCSDPPAQQPGNGFDTEGRAIPRFTWMAEIALICFTLYSGAYHAFASLLSGVGFSPAWDSALVWIYYLARCAGCLGILGFILDRHRRQRRAAHEMSCVASGESCAWRRACEVALVLWVAFGLSIFHSLQLLSEGATVADWPSSFAWTNEVWDICRKAASLLLLGYVLYLNGCRFSDLGFTWNRWQCAMALPLIVGITVAYLVWLPLVSWATAFAAGFHFPAPDLGPYFYGERILFISVFAAVTNGFFEELIVRAYLMTQLERLWRSKLLAAAASVIVQVSYHFYQGTPAALGHIAAFSIMALYYSRTRRILPVALAHVFLDLLPMILYAARLKPPYE